MIHELYKNKKDIEYWLNQHKIKKYELIEDIEYGYIVNVNDTVFLFNETLKEIKVKFNKIKGNFSVMNNDLISLYGCPEEVNGYFNCSFNQIKTLKYCPRGINGYLNCSHNQLENLEYFPSYIKGYLDCSFNKITKINIHCKEIDGTMNISNNELVSLEGCPEIINGRFDISYNKLNTLEFIPKKVLGKVYINGNVSLNKIQDITSFEELYILHKEELNKKLKETLQKSINISNNKIENIKI